MDGHFVPNFAFGHQIVSCLRKFSADAFIDCHMMVSDPEKWIDVFCKAGANQYTFHLEATEHHDAVIHQIRSEGMRVGLAIKPKTPVASLLPHCPKIDLALVMTVEPGFGGQKFMADMMPKVSELRAKFPDLDIQVDGGCGPSTCCLAARAGANIIVSGSAVFVSENPGATMRQMQSDCEYEFRKRE